MKVRKEAGQILTDRSESPAQPRGIPETTRSGSSYPCNEQVRPSMTSAFCPLISPPPPSALSIAPPSSYPQAREANRREHPGTPHPCLPSSLPHRIFNNETFWLLQLGGMHTGFWGSKARDAATYLTMHRTAPTTKDYPTQNVSRIEIKKLV